MQIMVRGKIEGKYDVYTTRCHPGTMGVACSLLKSPEPKTIEAVAPEAVAPKAKAGGPEAEAVEAERIRRFTARHADKHSCPRPFLISYLTMILLWIIIWVIVMFWLAVFISKQDFRWCTQQKFTLIIKFSIH